MGQANIADNGSEMGGPQRFETGGPLGCVLEQDTPTPAHTGAAQWRPAVAFVKLFDAKP